MGSVNSRRFNRFGVGFLAGIIGTIAGFVVMMLWWSWANGTTVTYFVEDVFIRSALYKDSILTISVLFNVGVFWIALQKNWEQFARGILGVIFIAVPLIIWYQAQAF